MEGLLSFLLFAGFFYLMMRLGCGSHMVHGHSKKEGHAVSHKDPVCGMEVAPEQGYGKVYEGQLYRFCSRSCLDKFDAEPQRYLEKKEGEAS